MKSRIRLCLAVLTALCLCLGLARGAVAADNVRAIQRGSEVLKENMNTQNVRPYISAATALRLSPGALSAMTAGACCPQAAK